MSEEVEEKEQITKEPEEKPKRIKDPKRVAAGKRLAGYHKEAKQALEEKRKREAEKGKEEVEEEDYSPPWIPEFSLTTILSIVGITLTAVDLFFRWINQGKKGEVDWKSPPIIHDREETKTSKPRIGMA